MKTLHIITACSRFSFLHLVLAESVAQAVRNQKPKHRVRWHIAFQHPSQVDSHGCVKFNEMIDLVPAQDWIWILDDDNDVHPNFFTALQAFFDLQTEKRAVVFSQRRADCLGPVLEAKPENMKPGGVDTAQVVFRKDLIGPLRFPENSKIADGLFYQQLFQIHGEKEFMFVSDPVVHFNALEDE